MYMIKFLLQIGKDENHNYLQLGIFCCFLVFSILSYPFLPKSNTCSSISSRKNTSLESVMISGKKFTLSFNTFPLPPPLALVLSMVKIRPETPRFRCCTCNKEREVSRDCFVS